MIDMTNFKKSVKWYDENLAALLPQYRGKYVGVCIDCHTDNVFRNPVPLFNDGKASFSIRTPSEGDVPLVVDVTEAAR